MQEVDQFEKQESVTKKHYCSLCSVKSSLFKGRILWKKMDKTVLRIKYKMSCLWLANSSSDLWSVVVGMKHLIYSNS